MLKGGWVGFTAELLSAWPLRSCFLVQDIRHRSRPSTSMSNPGNADAAAKAAAAQQAVQAVHDKRIELGTRLSSLIDLSVLQFFNSLKKITTILMTFCEVSNF